MLKEITTTAAVLMLLSGMANAGTKTANMDVTLTVEESCVLTVDPLEFGNHVIVDENIKANTKAHVTCTTGTPYLLTSDVTHSYELKNTSDPDAHPVKYALYLDAAMTQPLAQAAPDEATVAGSSNIGNGEVQSVDIYGALLDTELHDVSAGEYSDTVMLQLTY